MARVGLTASAAWLGVGKTSSRKSKATNFKIWEDPEECQPHKPDETNKQATPDLEANHEVNPDLSSNISAPRRAPNRSRMAFFTALNVEPEENPEEDVDNTREIQLEEALKLYQNALKLHSQGPDFYTQAASAYDLLFKSEVFKYPESLSEYDRLELRPEAEFQVELAFLELDISAAAVSDGSNSLPQILFLSFKNHGQFIIDCLKHELRSGKKLSDAEVRAKASRALEQFTQALARNESDTELWRRAARISSMLGSDRIVRYCLEAAVEVDDDPTQREVEPAALEEGLAGMLLKEHLEVIADEPALDHPIMDPYKTKNLSSRLRKYMDPYPFLPKLSQVRAIEDTDVNTKSSTSRLEVELTERSWSAMGDALMRAWLTTQGVCNAVTLKVPDGDGEEDDIMVDVHESPLEATTTDEQAKELAERPKEFTLSDSGTDLTSREAAADSAETVAEPAQSEQDTSQGSRKRSQSAAGLRDTPDDENGTAKRSKRIRNRDTLGAEGLPVDPVAANQERLQEINGADTETFNLVNSLLVKLGTNTLGSFEAFRASYESTTPLQPDAKNQDTLLRDVRDILQNWNETNAVAYIAGTNADVLNSSPGGSSAGLAAFLEHSKGSSQKTATENQFPPAAGISKFIQMVNNGWLPLEDVIYEYFNAIKSTYVKSAWPESMKFSLMQLMSAVDGSLYQRVADSAESLRESGVNRETTESMVLIGQMLFELHLDLYASITNPGSRVELTIRLAERERVARWSVLATSLMQGRSVSGLDSLILRHLWASSFYASIGEEADREHVIACWTDMKRILKEAGCPEIEIVNNVAMPEISVTAAEREVSKLTTTEFFVNLFSSDDADPIVVIETLEPVLDPQAIEGLVDDGAANGSSSLVSESGSSLAPSGVTPASREMWKFLQGGNAALRLFLWQRLREAYQKIEYPTKVFSCYLKSIEVIVNDMMIQKFVDASPEARQHTLLSWLKTLDNLLVKALTMALNDPKAFEIIDAAHIKSTTNALVHLCRCLHAAALFEDEVKLGFIVLPQTSKYSTGSPFGQLLVRIREMQVRCWALIYTMIRDGATQDTEAFPTKDIDLSDYLAYVHYSLGIRRRCKSSNKIFLKMMKVEMIKFKHVDTWQDYISQVLYDLYGLKLGVGLFEIQEHGCPIEFMDRRTAFSIADKVTALANQMQMKDLLKHDLRGAIEKMQQVIGAVKPTPSLQHNSRIITEYLKSSINPLNMNRSLKGQFALDQVPVKSPDSQLADSGWYFLHGMMALSKFKSQKRLAPGSTDDLKVAVTFFRIQLQFDMEHWESWFRLAQVYDADLEEMILFSADKLNTPADRKLLNTTQRHAIHSYTMAMSVAMRNADNSLETAGKLSDMYHDFGMRVYSTSRAPFNMEPFYMDDYKRFSSGPQGIYDAPVHPEMATSKALRFASELFRRASVEKPEFWMNHYMRGKCQWKIFCRSRGNQNFDAKVAVQQLLHSFEKAIKVCPRPNRSEPILEPHYKYMTIMHKLVLAEEIPIQEAADKMQLQPFAIEKGAHMPMLCFEDWRRYILASIRNVQHADKSNWHHRMIFRVARILFDQYNPTLLTANEAYKELKVSMFTKTMVFNVWKPEYERAGRHCVYTAIYIQFMSSLLQFLEDRPNLEQLAKRVRKKSADIFQFTKVWTYCLECYLDILKKDTAMIYCTDEVVKMPIDEFNAIADVLQAHIEASSPEDMPKHLDRMKEAEDLKKLNSNLIKAPALDEFIQDLYASIFLHVGKPLPRPKKEPSPAPVPAPAPEPRQQGPMSISAMMGITEETPAVTPQPAPEIVKPKVKSVTKKDILRRAEALLTKPEAPKPTAATASKSKAGEQARKQIGQNGSHSGNGNGKDGNKQATEDGKDKEEGENEDKDSGGDAADDADDESDLSDLSLDEEMEAEVTGEIERTFPYLEIKTAGTWNAGNS